MKYLESLGVHVFEKKSDYEEFMNNAGKNTFLMLAPETVAVMRCNFHLYQNGDYTDIGDNLAPFDKGGIRECAENARKALKEKAKKLKIENPEEVNIYLDPRYNGLILF